MGKPRKHTIHLSSGGRIEKTSRYIPPPRPTHIHHHHTRTETSCFPATAKVLTPVGVRMMGELHPGDRVMSFAPLSMTLIPRFVTRRLEHGAQRLWAVKINSVDEPVLVTPTHRFLTDQGWRQARDLCAGSKVVFVDAGKVWDADVTSSELSDEIAPVYNLYSSGEHNLVVDGLVAHNFVYFGAVRTLFHNWMVDPAYDGLRPVAV